MFSGWPPIFGASATETKLAQAVSTDADATAYCTRGCRGPWSISSNICLGCIEQMLSSCVRRDGTVVGGAVVAETAAATTSLVFEHTGFTAERAAPMRETLRLGWAKDLDARALYELLKLRVEVFVIEQAIAYPELDGRDLLAVRVCWRRRRFHRQRRTACADAAGQLRSGGFAERPHPSSVIVGHDLNDTSLDSVDGNRVMISVFGLAH